MLEFQEHVLKQKLDRLPARSRIAFAACCAQRTSAICHRYLSQSNPNRAATLDAAMRYAWDHILSASQRATTDRMLESVMSLIPDQDAPGWTPLTAYAEDALSALAYCLQCVQSGDTQEATWAARRVYEALDYFVTVRDNLSPDEPEGEVRILRDPMVQTELERQARDITELSAVGDTLSQQLLDKLRHRSEVEQAIGLRQLD